MTTTQSSFAGSPPPPRGRPSRQPSGRNLELYHELVYEGRSRALVAARFRVSHQRVSQLRLQIAAWVDASIHEPEAQARDLGTGIHESRSEGPPSELTFPRLCLDSAAARFHLAIALRRLQLDDAYRAYLGHFGGPSGAAAFGHLLAAQDAGYLPREAASRLPPRDLVITALRMARELDDLARIARRGPFFQLPEQLRQAASQQHEADPSSTQG